MRIRTVPSECSLYMQTYRLHAEPEPAANSYNLVIKLHLKSGKEEVQQESFLWLLEMHCWLLSQSLGALCSQTKH